MRKIKYQSSRRDDQKEMYSLSRAEKAEVQGCQDTALRRCGHRSPVGEIDHIVVALEVGC